LKENNQNEQNNKTTKLPVSFFLTLTSLEFHDILNLKMGNASLQPRFIRPFSRGQITIPKDYREYLDIDENSWLRIVLKEDQILIKPIEEERQQRKLKPKISFEKYLKMLPQIQGVFGDELAKENKQIRKEVEKRLKKIQF